MNAFLVSLAAVAVAEIGDKTQLLAMVLSCRFRRPWPITAGILVATLLNHAAAGVVGTWVAGLLGDDLLRWIAGLGFLAMAGWALLPDQLAADEAERGTGHGAFVATLISFFLAEMGDKTQIATVALAARFENLTPVVIGTTLGLMVANVPAVFLTDRLTARLRLEWVRWIAAALFAAVGIATIVLG